MEKIKRAIIKFLRNQENKPYIANSKGSWTTHELADEIEKETGVGMDMIESMMVLTADLILRGKKTLPAPSPSQVLTAEESDNDLVEKFMAIIPLADPGFVENLAFECSKVAKKYSTLQTQQLQNRVKELEEQLSVMPTRKHQIVSEVVELREQVKLARNEAIQECIEVLNTHHDELPLAKSDSDNGYSIAFANAVNILEKLKSKQ